MADTQRWAQSTVGALVADTYEVTGILGLGHMSGVFTARHVQRGGRPFALKLIVPLAHPGERDEQAKRFAREAAVAREFEHPRSVRVRDFGVDRRNGLLYMAMDHVDGTTLEATIRDAREGNAPGAAVIAPRRAVRVSLMILDVVESAHARGLVHRDIKPANVMTVDRDGEEDIRILDFGFAKALSAASGADPGLVLHGAHARDPLLLEKMTAKGTIVGTPQYMAPEQARGEEVTYSVDLYATGVVLYEMLSGLLPHRGETPHQLLFARAFEPHIPLRTARPDLSLPAPLVDALDRSLASSPAKRFADAKEFAGALQEAMR
jgi:serine/threonine-protein kinase